MDVNDALTLACAMGVEVYELAGIEADAELARVGGVPVVYVRSGLRGFARSRARPPPAAHDVRRASAGCRVAPPALATGAPMPTPHRVTRKSARPRRRKLPHPYTRERFDPAPPAQDPTTNTEIETMKNAATTAAARAAHEVNRASALVSSRTIVYRYGYGYP